MVAVATKTAENPAQALAERAGVAAAVTARMAPTLQLPIKLLFPAGVHHGVQTFHMLGLGDMAIPGLFLAFALAFDAYLEHEHARKDGRLGGGAHAGGGVLGGSGGSGGDGWGKGDVEAGHHRGQRSGEGRSGGGGDAHEDPLGAPFFAASPFTSSSSPPSPPPPPPSLSPPFDVGGDGETPQDAVGPWPPPAPPAPVSKAYFYAARSGYVAGIVLSIAASRLTGVAQPALLYLVPCVLGPLLWRAAGRRHLGLLWGGFHDPTYDQDPTGEGGEPAEDARTV